MLHLISIFSFTLSTTNLCKKECTFWVYFVRLANKKSFSIGAEADRRQEEDLKYNSSTWYAISNAFKVFEIIYLRNQSENSIQKQQIAITK